MPRGSSAALLGFIGTCGLTDHRALSTPFRFERADLLAWRSGEIELSGVDELVDYVCDILEHAPSFVWR